MKRLLSITVASILALSATAQTKVNSKNAIIDNANHFSMPEGGLRAKTTTGGVYHDSVLMVHLVPTDSPKIYYATRHTDSGFIFGTSAYGFNGFAERYDFTAADSTIEVLGVYSLFGGTVNPASTKTVNFYAWSVGSPVTIRSTLSISGLPGAAIDSVAGVSIHNLKIHTTPTMSDSFSAHYFATPTSYLSSSFFVGYTMNYNFGALAGDTISVYTSQLTGNPRSLPLYTITAGDTVYNTVNAFQDTAAGANRWYDCGFNGFLFNYYLFPIVNIHVTEGTSGITNRNLTFFGNYPNPATNNTNIKFSLANSTDVYIIIADMNGNVINTIEQTNLTAGQHVYNLDTHNLSAGNYTYIVRTANGGGIASKLTIVK